MNKEGYSLPQHVGWIDTYLDRISTSSPEGREAVIYVRNHNIRVFFRRARKSVGAFWTLGGDICLNSRHFTQESALALPRAWTLFVHEVRHLQQGPLIALSIYGELDAWQHEFALYRRLTNQNLSPVLDELLSLPLNHDRKNLMHARRLMMRFAGDGYGAWLLPLLPIHWEIEYLFSKCGK